MKKTAALLLSIVLALSLSAGIKAGIISTLDSTGLPRWLIVIIISALPVFELRGGIPIAVNVYDMSIYTAFILAFIGNIIPVIPILLFLRAMYRFFERWKYTKQFFDSIFERTRSRSEQIEKYKMIGLISFVAIPLPITGAWTGSIAAVLFNIRFRDAVVSIIIGVIIAGIIVTTLSVMGIWGAVIAGAVLLVIAISSLMKSRLQEDR